MRVLVFCMIASVLLGWVSTPSAQVRQVAQKYQSVDRSMKQQTVYRLLGQPQNDSPDGRHQWRVAEGKNSAELFLRFSDDGRITSVEKHYSVE